MGNEDSLRKAEQSAEEGSRALTKGDYLEAEKLFIQAADIYSRLDDSLKRLTLLKRIAEIRFISGQMERALETELELLASFEQSRDSASQAGAYNNIGLIQVRLRDYQNALSSFDKARALFQNVNNIPGIAEQWGNIGSVYRDVEKYQEALDNYDKSLSLCRELGEPERIGNQLTNIAYIHAMRGDYGEALELYREGLSFYDKSENKKRAEATRQNILNIEKTLKSNYSPKNPTER